jgi:hypothetical protein
MSGPTMLVGCPGSGKTYLAWELAKADCDRTAYPILVVDTARVDTFAHLHHTRSVRETIERVWGAGLTCAYTPESPEEFDRLMQAARAGKKVIIVIDELKNVLPSVRSMSLPFQMALRLYRHSEIEGVYATTQCYADAARPLKAVVSDWRFFRINAGGDRADIHHDFGVPEETLAALPSARELVQRGEDPMKAHVHIKTGF